MEAEIAAISGGFSRARLGESLLSSRGRTNTLVGSLSRWNIEAQELLINSVLVARSIARNKKLSMILPVTLWVFGKRVQAKALKDSGATTNFIDRKFVENNHLVTNKLANPYNVSNADGTPNSAGQITHYVRAYTDVGGHKSTQYYYVTDLGNKDVMLGYTFLHEHNPTPDYRKGELVFNRCPEQCHADRANHEPLDAETDEIHGEFEELPLDHSLDAIEDEDPDNPTVNWIDISL